MGQPFRYNIYRYRCIGNDVVDPFLARYAQGYDSHEPEKVYPHLKRSIRIENGLLMIFYVKRFTFIISHRVLDELKLIDEAVVSYNLIYNSLSI